MTQYGTPPIVWVSPSIKLYSLDYIPPAVPLCPLTLCNSVVEEKMEHKLSNLYSVFLALWEFTDPATMTKSYKPLFLEYHCFCLLGLVYRNHSSLLNCQALSLLFRCWSPRGNPPIGGCVSCFSHILLHYTVNTNKHYLPLFCFWPPLQSVTTTCVAVE